MSARRRSPVLLVCCCLTAYFGFHAVHGKHGLEARVGLQAKSLKLVTELAALTAVRDRLQLEVALLSESGADPAFVEEVARDLLAYARPRDRILLSPDRRLEISAAPASR